MSVVRPIFDAQEANVLWLGRSLVDREDLGSIPALPKCLSSPRVRGVRKKIKLFGASALR